MQHLDSLLRLDESAGELLSTARKLGSRIRLIGPSGSGKSTIARRVARQWGGQVFWIVADRESAAIPYLSLYRSLDGRRPKKAIRDLNSSEGIDFLRDIPFAGNTLALLVKQIVARKSVSGPDFLGKEQQDILNGFQFLSNEKAALFIIDEVNWLDAASSELFNVMQHSEVLGTYSVAREASFIIVQNSERSEYDERRNERLVRNSTKYFTKLPSRDDFPEILMHMGLNVELSSTQYDKLHALTKGHLALSREIVRLVRNGVVDAGQPLSTYEICIENFAVKMLRLKLDSLELHSSKLERLLSVAACVGEFFSKGELECAFSNPEAFTSILDLAKQEEFLIDDGNFIRFAHSIIREALLKMSEIDHPAYHDKIAECVRLLQPGEYRRRYIHSRQSVDQVRTSALALTLLLQAARGEIAGVLDSDQWKSDLGDLLELFEVCEVAIKAIDVGDFNSAIRALVPHYDGSNNLPQAELAYLLSLSYFKSRSTNGYESARSILEPWLSRKEEGEVWYRLMLTLIVVYLSLDQRSECAQLLQRIRMRLDKKAAYDVGARMKLQVLNRKAEMFYPLEVAGSLIRNSVAYFSPVRGTTVPKNVFQYTAALVNLSGNLYVRGEFSGSATCAVQALSCISEMTGRFRTVEAYKALNNYVVAAFRAGNISAKEAANLLEELSEPLPVDQLLDRSLVSINQAVFEVLDGRTELGCTILDRIYTSLKRLDTDGFYLMFAGSNLAPSRFLLGDIDGANSLIAEAKLNLESVPRELRSCFKNRLTALSKLFSENMLSDTIRVDRYPREFDEHGPHVAWKSLGFGFILSDIQVWSES